METVKRSVVARSAGGEGGKGRVRGVWGILGPYDQQSPKPFSERLMRNFIIICIHRSCQPYLNLLIGIQHRVPPDVIQQEVHCTVPEVSLSK